MRKGNWRDEECYYLVFETSGLLFNKNLGAFSSNYLTIHHFIVQNLKVFTLRCKRQIISYVLHVLS
jgi:hypothetical protein